MDRFSSLGLVLGIGALFGTQFIEGGHPASLVQGPAAIIVFLGTLGATFLSCSGEELRRARIEFFKVFWTDVDRKRALVVRFRDLAFIARKDGLVSLDKALRSLPTPFMQRALRHVIDGCEESQLQKILDADVRARTTESLAAAEVFEVAGG